MARRRTPPPADRERGRPWTFQDYFEAVAFGLIPMDCLKEYRRTNEMFDRWLRVKARKTRDMVESWRAEADGA